MRNANAAVTVVSKKGILTDVWCWWLDEWMLPGAWECELRTRWI